MTEIKKIKGTNTNVIDYMARDYDSLLHSMRQMIPQKLPEWKDYRSGADYGNVMLQLFAHMGDIIGYYQDRIANESFLGTAQERRSIIHHLRLIGYRLATAAPAAAMLELTVDQNCNETVTITKGDAFTTRSRKDSPAVRFEYTGGQDLVIDFSAITPVGGKKKFSALPVEEGRLVKDELIGVSDGTPGQRFRLAHGGLILQSLGIGSGINKDVILKTKLGVTWEEWWLKETLIFSRQGQLDFVIETDEEDGATVIFGDGNFGPIPPSGAEIFVTYRVGGGIRGNVAAGAIDTIMEAPQLALLGATVGNPAPATGGADRESIGHAVDHAPEVFRSMKRAVTADDYKALALDFKGVGKVRAESSGWNNVTLYVAPQGGGKVSDVLIQNLLAYFEDKRHISTIVEIADVDYIKIYITAELGIESYYAPDEVMERAAATVNRLLHFDNVDFGQTLYLSKFYEALEGIEGVAFVTITEFRRQDDTAVFQSASSESSGRIVLLENEVPAPPSDAPGDQEYGGGVKLVRAGGAA
jgi:hypothetical protein